MKKTYILLALLGLAMAPRLQAAEKEMTQEEKNKELLRAVTAGDDTGVERMLDLKADVNRMVHYKEKFKPISSRQTRNLERERDMSILNYALEVDRHNSVLTLLRYKADPTIKDYDRTNGCEGTNALYKKLGHGKLSLILLLHPKINSEELHNIYNLQSPWDCEWVKEYLSQERTQLFHADTIRLKNYLPTITSLATDTLNIIAAYAAYYIDIPKRPLLLDKPFTPIEISDAQKALDEAEEIYFDAPTKKPKINKEEMQQKIQELTMDGDFVEAQRLMDLLYGKV